MAKKTNHKPHGKRKLHVQTASLTPDKGTAVQRPHKDTLFRFIFRDKKKLLQLYNALNQSDYQDPDGLQITTLENVVYLSYKNDISFLVDINYGHNREFMKQCKPLMEYSRFIHCIRKNIQNSCSPTEAADLAVEYCLANGILTDVLRAHRKEVVGMFLEDYDEELHYRTLRREGYEDGYDDGIEEGKKLHFKQQVKKKLDKGKTIELIAEELEETVEAIEEIMKELA